MTSGYTPLFSSLTTGTLCGRWPDVGLWAIVLSLSNRYGVVDVTPDYLSRVTGLPIDDVTACMRRFCEPDPFSRSTAEGGARLTLIDPDRLWGWRIVNHGKYREKARKAHYDSERTESGRDATRKRFERVQCGDVPTPPAKSPGIPLSDQSNSDQRHLLGGASVEAESKVGFASVKTAYPAGIYPQSDWLYAEREARRRVDEGHTWAELIAGCQRYAAQCGAKGQTGTQYVSSPKKFFTLPECRFKESFPLQAASSERGKPSPPTEVERLQKLNDRRAGTRHLQNFRDPNPRRNGGSIPQSSG